MEFYLFKVLGVVGLLLVTAGVLLPKDARQDWLFLFGSAGLFIYSYSLGDSVFMILQAVFAGASTYEIVKRRRRRRA